MDLNEGQGLGLVEAIELATKRRIHLSTAIRWCTRGVYGVRLQNYSCGKRRLTTVEWVREFNARVAEARDGANAAPIETPSERTKRAKASAAKLAAKLAGKPKVRK